MPELNACPECGYPAQMVGGLVHCKQCETSPSCQDQPSINAHHPVIEVDAARYTLMDERGQMYGPIGRLELDQWVTQGRVNAHFQVLRDGSQQWQWIADLFPQVGYPPAAAGDNLDYSFNNNKLTAVLLNLFFPGLGQIMLGRVQTGVGMLLSWFFLIVATLCSGGLGLPLAFLLWIAAIADAIFQPTPRQ